MWRERERERAREREREKESERERVREREREIERLFGKKRKNSLTQTSFPWNANGNHAVKKQPSRTRAIFRDNKRDAMKFNSLYVLSTSCFEKRAARRSTASLLRNSFLNDEEYESLPLERGHASH